MEINLAKINLVQVSELKKGLIRKEEYFFLFVNNKENKNAVRLGIYHSHGNITDKQSDK